MTASPPKRLRWLPNALTISRAILAIVMFAAALLDVWHIAFWLLCAALVTDFLDGIAARKLNVSSAYGEALDAFADFLLAILGLLSLSITGHLSWWACGIAFAIAAAIGSDRIIDQPAWKWRALLAVVALFLAWISILWFYAYLTFGWSPLYIPLTLIILIVCGLLKRRRVLGWLRCQ